ncbi:Unknown protein, partial [Striga hermonthica]
PLTVTKAGPEVTVPAPSPVSSRSTAAARPWAELAADRSASADRRSGQTEPEQHEVPQATVVAQFRDYHLEKFFGQGDPRIVDEWFQGLELIFEVMDCLDRYRYYPTYYRAEMERQFLSLKQGTRSVDEYEREFTRLGAFVLDPVRTEAQRAQRFIDELLPKVRHNIVGHGVQSYARTVIIAQEVDASIRREANHDRLQPVSSTPSSSAPPAQPATTPQQRYKNKRKNRGGQDDRRNRPRQQQPIPPCPTCGKIRRRDCLMGQNT